MTVLQGRKPDGSKGQRAEDKSFWAAFDYLTTKYKLLIWIIAWAALAAGFGLRLPIQTINENKNSINSKVDTVYKTLQSEIDELRADHKTLGPELTALKDDMNIQLRWDCADKYHNSYDKALVGLKCTK